MQFWWAPGNIGTTLGSQPPVAVAALPCDLWFRLFACATNERLRKRSVRKPYAHLSRTLRYAHTDASAILGLWALQGSGLGVMHGLCAFALLIATEETNQ